MGNGELCSIRISSTSSPNIESVVNPGVRAFSGSIYWLRCDDFVDWASSLSVITGTCRCSSSTSFAYEF
jgi:hypothetical protein